MCSVARRKKADNLKDENLDEEHTGTETKGIVLCCLGPLKGSVCYDEVTLIECAHRARTKRLSSRVTVVSAHSSRNLTLRSPGFTPCPRCLCLHPFAVTSLYDGTTLVLPTSLFSPKQVT